MIFVIICLFDHFTLKHVSSVNGVWIIAFVSQLHVWVTKPQPLLMFFQVPVLTSNNVIWVDLSAILFDKTQHIVKTSTADYMPVCYEVINLFTKPQNFQLMFFICKHKDLYLIIFFFDGLLMFFFHFVCTLLSNLWKKHITAVSLKVFCLWLLTYIWLLLKITAHTYLPH